MGKKEPWSLQEETWSALLLIFSLFDFSLLRLYIILSIHVAYASLSAARFPEWNRLTIRWLMSTQCGKSGSVSHMSVLFLLKALHSLFFSPSLFFHITLISYRLLLKPLRATPWRCLSSLTSHLILSRPIRSVLICSLNHNHHTNTHTHTHACTLTQCRLQSHHIHASLRPLVCLKKWALMILLLFYCCVKPKVQLYKGSGTSACVTAHERGAFGISLWFPWSFQLWTLNFLWSLKV